MRRLMVYDSTQGGLSTLWGAGQILGNFDVVVAATSWTQLEGKLLQLDDFDHVQLWGHGSPGRPVINSASMPAGWEACLPLVRNDHRWPIVWFRACAVFSGSSGIRFAERFAESARCVTAGHTRNISTPWVTHQSGGFAIRPGEEAHWSPNEGIGSNGKPLGSSPWAPNTCLVTAMNVPSSWYS